MKIIDWQQIDATEKRDALMRSTLINDNQLSDNVNQIIAQVAQDGDLALKAFSEKFDNVKLDELSLKEAEINAACANVSPEIKAAIDVAMKNIEAFHCAQQPQALKVETQQGVTCELHTEAINKVGLYIPGGTAPLISTVMMLALPAKIAGCQRRVLVSPPPINDAIIYTAKACGITEIFQVGGAQAIAALAYGTESIPAVDKIFGPGNRFVTEAKRQVSQDPKTGVSIDMPAGPSEVLVIADKEANAAFIAADLLSQAEHGPDSQVILVTTCAQLAKQVNNELSNQLEALPRAEVAKIALSESRIILADNLEQAVEISNLYGPEHLIVQTQEPRTLLPQIRCAGSVFLGKYTPESVGDYASGTNHVLPTYGYSRAVSSLSLADFSRRFTVQEVTAAGLAELGPAVMTLAAAEQLNAHENAVAIRLATMTAES